MTVAELKDILEDIEDDVEIKVAIQPNYPLRARLSNVCRELGKDYENKALWLAVSNGVGYGVPSEVWEYDRTSGGEDE